MNDLHRRYEAIVDRLESRRLLTSAAHATLRDGIVHVFGTDSADTATVSIVHNVLRTTIDGHRQSFPLAVVHQIYFIGDAGDDHLNAAAIGLPTIFYGGDGDDWIQTAAPEGFIDGGAGSDHIAVGTGQFDVGGNDGVDFISGITRDDSLFYGDRDDYINGVPDQITPPQLIDGEVHIIGSEAPDHITVSTLGGTALYVAIDDQYQTIENAATARIVIDAAGGDDVIDAHLLSVGATIRGGAGDDSIDGGKAADRIYGGDGDDQLNGLGGNDVLYGEAGADNLKGGDGRDDLDGGVGADTLRGQAGLDHLITHTDDTVYNQHDWIELQAF